MRILILKELQHMGTQAWGTDINTLSVNLVLGAKYNCWNIDSLLNPCFCKHMSFWNVDILHAISWGDDNEKAETVQNWSLLSMNQMYGSTYFGPWAYSEGVKTPGNDFQVELLHWELLEDQHTENKVNDK